MTDKTINDSVGPESLFPVLLVFGASPRLGLLANKLPTTTFQRAVAFQNAMEVMSKNFSKRQVRDALNTQNSPAAREIHKGPIFSFGVSTEERYVGRSIFVIRHEQSGYNHSEP